MKKFFALIIGAMLALTLASSPTFARNEVINKWFQDGGKIDPIQGGTGVAHWEMTRPDNGETMYFEKCWEEPKGFACKYEVLIGSNAHGDDSHHDQMQVSSDGELCTVGTPSDAELQNKPGDDWSGIFECAVKTGDHWVATTYTGDNYNYTECVLYNDENVFCL
jgi:hypothetical protein